MTAEREDPTHYNPDGEVAPIPMPVQISIRTNKSLGKNPDKVFASLGMLKKHKDLYPVVKKFQDLDNNVHLQWNAHKGVIITAIAIGAGAAAGILVKRARERRKQE